MTATVFSVLRSGGDYMAEHVRRLRDQVAEYSPDLAFVCLTDMAVPGVETLQLSYGWPGWWSKMEMFRPDIEGDILYLDLDSSVVGDITAMASVERLTLMRDAYRPGGLQSSAMLVPKADRKAIWQSWTADPVYWMNRYRLGGDQAFLERFWLSRAERWQETLPGCLASYKAEICRGRSPDLAPDAVTLAATLKLVVFHGRPRPWTVGW